MDCQHVEFAANKSEERIQKALRVFPKAILMRILTFALHLLGAKRKDVARLVGMKEESVKTVVRIAMRDGFMALRDRRCSIQTIVESVPPKETKISASRQGEWIIVDLGQNRCIEIPVSLQIQAKTVLLSLVNAGLLSNHEAASALNITEGHCRELARKLSGHDVVESLVDKRQGLKQEYLVGPEQKAEIIQQLAARIITGKSTASSALAEAIEENTEVKLSARTIRWHIKKLGLSNIKETLPQLVEKLKKNS